VTFEGWCWIFWARGRSRPRWSRPLRSRPRRSRWSRPWWSRPLRSRPQRRPRPFTAVCTYSALLALLSRFFSFFTSINIFGFQQVMSPQSPPPTYHRYLHTRRDYRAYRPKYYVLLTATYRSLRITLSRFREAVKPHCETSIHTSNYLPQILLRRIPIRNLDRLGARVTKSLILSFPPSDEAFIQLSSESTSGNSDKTRVTTSSEEAMKS
jgi:hypothetical protein